MIKKKRSILFIELSPAQADLFKKALDQLNIQRAIVPDEFLGD